MRPTSARRGDWLARRVGFFGSVGGVAGAGFEAYARILHPAEAVRHDVSVVDDWGIHPVLDTRFWGWAEVAAHNGRAMHPLVQWLRLDSEAAADDGWRIEAPREGWFDPALCAALTRHLSDATTTPDDITIGIWTGFGGRSGSAVVYSYSPLEDGEHEAVRDAQLHTDGEELRGALERSVLPEYRAVVAATSMGGTHDQVFDLPNRDYLVLGGTLTELADPDWGYGAGIGWMPQFPPDPTPQLIWPEDQAWVVGSEIDWDSTIVAGSRELVDAVLADPTFEAFEVQETDCLTIDSDTINR